MAKGHLRAVEMEEVHELDGTTGPQSSVVHSPRLVIELDVYREYFDLLCTGTINELRSASQRTNPTYGRRSLLQVPLLAEQLLGR